MESDFKNMGKKMPYTVPEGFFSDMEKNLLAQAPAGQRPEKRTWKPWMSWTAISSIAAAIVAGVLAWGISSNEVVIPPGEVDFLYSYDQDMTEGEMVEMADMIASDIFLELLADVE